MTVAIAKMMSAKLARRSRLTGGSPARVSPKIEYSPVFARPSASAAPAACSAPHCRAATRARFVIVCQPRQ